MGEDKIIEVKEDKISITTNVTPNSTEVEEEVEDVVVQVAAPLSLEIEDESLIDIEIEEAFPYIVSGVLDKTLGDKDVLIDAGVAIVDNNDETVGLHEVIEAAAAQGSSGIVDHSLLNGRESEEQHPITAISGLRDELDDIETIKRVYSSENGLSEFRKWDDGNPDMENRAGYFVKLVQGTDNIAICTDEDDVYGISVTNSGFVGNQIQADKSDDPSYAMVGIAGALRVRTDGTARNGEYVVPNALGEATFSANNCGYKVVSQGSYASYPYVTIAVTPQNDKISKIYGMLTDTGNGSTIGNLIIQIEDLEGQLKENDQKVDIIVSDNESIKDIINENKENIKEVIDVSKTALDTAQEAKDSVASAVNSANEATQKAERAALEAQNAANKLVDVMELADEMEPLIDFESGEYIGVAGYVAMATETHMDLGALMKTVDEQGSDIASLMIRKDEDGMSIQSLVSHIDKYSVGQYSTSYNLSKSNAQSIFVDEYIYVPTTNHVETMYVDETTTEEISFVRGYSYEWDHTNGTWVQSQEVSLAIDYQDGMQEGDLWLCWQDVEKRNENEEVVATYVPGTLYRWFNTAWIAVASVADNAQSRMLTSVTQTADDITQSVLNATGEGSTVKQGLDSIFSTVWNNKGYISAIEQTAESIRAGTYSAGDTASQLEMLVSDTDASLNALTSGRFHIVYQTYLGEAPKAYENGNKYTDKPFWDEKRDIFVFDDENDIDNTNGIYYFYSADQTKYCKVIEDGYEIYTIGNKATSGLQSRITNAEAILSGTAALDTENSSALSTVTVKADENGSSVASVASYYYHSLVRIEEKEPTFYGTYKYIKPPVWNIGLNKYVFDINDRHSDGIIYSNLYWLIDEAAQTYCKTVTIVEDDKSKTVYEIYGLGGNSSASIVQEVSINKSVIGMIADNGKVSGGLLIKAINDYTEADLSTDKINLTGYVTISSLTSTGTTVIDGSRITTGIIKSSGYSHTDGNTYSTTGTSFDLSNGVIRSKNFAIDSSGNAYFKGNIDAQGGTIGGFTIGTSALYNSKSSLTSTDLGVYLGTDGISVGAQTVTKKIYTGIGNSTSSSITAPAFQVTADGAITCGQLSLLNGGSIYPEDIYMLSELDKGENVSGVGMNYASTKGIQFIAGTPSRAAYISNSTNGSLNFLLAHDQAKFSFSGQGEDYGYLNMIPSYSGLDYGIFKMTTNSDLIIHSTFTKLESDEGVYINHLSKNDNCGTYYAAVSSDIVRFRISSSYIRIYVFDVDKNDWVEMGDIDYN